MFAQVTVSVDDAPAMPPSTYNKNQFFIMGDSKILRVLTIETNMFGVEEAFKRVRKRARRVDGATHIRHGLSTYTL